MSIIRVKMLIYCNKIRVKHDNMYKHIKNGKTFKLYAEAYNL